MKTLIEEANELLAWLCARRGPGWRAAVGEAFPQPETDKHISLCVKAAKQYYKMPAEPIGFVNMNLLTAVNECFDFILPSHKDLLVELMKSTGRLVQLGRGKGKMIVLISSHTIPDGHPLPNINPTNLKDLSKATAAADADIKYLVQRIESLEKDLAYKIASIAELTDKVNTTYRTTWT